MQEYVIPEGNINITDTSAVNVADYATAQVVDADLVPGNIKSGVNILGVQGSVVGLNGTTTTVHSGATTQTVTPTAPANGFTSVTVEPLNLEAKTMPLGANAPAAVTPTSGKDGLSSVAPSIDSTVIKAANIKSGATILGVTGSVTELNGSTTTVKSTTSTQTITPTSPSNGFTSVTVNPIVLENGTMALGAAAPATVAPTSGNDGLAQVAPSIDTTVIKAENIKSGTSILGVAGEYSGEPAVVVPTSITLGADAPTTVVPPSAGSGKNKFNIAASGVGTAGTLQQDGSYLISTLTGSWTNYASSGDVADGGTCLWLADESTRGLDPVVGSYSFKIKTATADTDARIQIYEVYEYHDRTTGAVVQRLHGKRPSSTFYVTSTGYTSITYSQQFGWY